MNQAEFVKGLRQLKKVFDKHGVTFWLEGGTLLGAIREGRMIPWDDDVDISLWLNDVFKVLETQNDLQQLGYELYITQGHYGLRDMITKKHIICIFFNKEISGYVVKLHFCRVFKHLIWILSEPDYNSLDYDNFDYDSQFIPFIFKKILVDISCKIQVAKRRKLITLLWKLTIKFRLYYDELIRSKFINGFATVDFYGEQFNVPKNYDDYLSFMYGNWRVPDKGAKLKIVRLKDVLI